MPCRVGPARAAVGCGVRRCRGEPGSRHCTGSGRIGGDVKYGITQNITADLTVNTDFAQVEVDEQQVNLTRFNLFFPEKRDFFLEGLGTFAFAGRASAGLGGFAPPTMHTLAARLGGAVSRRLFNVAITNVPGPQHPLFVAGAQMASTYPVMPLGATRALSIGLTSYDGGVYYGLYADRDALPDTDVLGQSIVDSLQELLDAPRSRTR